ncbi:hypothetical protein MTBPR1_120108 [Candidatus Terasakiella magnetica]|uniref:Uncharacterized protein n=1 Tax=Candidatus Terasakiella magnetica TaxID=1867952 RepID=A0A1C3REZ5_9PROT|nr:hypothetical protein [Candidatus Terasakiella magnetica]SCA55802.1 hypothetical protein MTBPR1_120108 [Candidatus Terasakiella magnetica]
MDHIAQFNQRASQDAALLDLYLFGWFDAKGDGGDYGLNIGPVQNTFQTLISTTYMFQPEPQFTLQCRAFQMTKAQFDYLQDHDLDTEDFLSQLGPLPEVAYSLDLSNFKDAASALEAMQALCAS